MCTVSCESEELVSAIRLDCDDCNESELEDLSVSDIAVTKETDPIPHIGLSPCTFRKE